MNVCWKNQVGDEKIFSGQAWLWSQKGMEMSVDAFIPTHCWFVCVFLGGAGCQTQSGQYSGCFGENQGGPS